MARLDNISRSLIARLLCCRQPSTNAQARNAGKRSFAFQSFLGLLLCVAIAPQVQAGSGESEDQLALTPAFLLTGIAGLLNVMAGRLARAIDRGRSITQTQKRPVGRESGRADVELNTLERRRKFTSIAITSSKISALLVCVVIALLFLKEMLGVPLNEAIGTVFTTAMLALVVGLLFFLRELHLAMRCVRLASQ